MVKVSIGVPVFNGGALLEEALRDIQRQSYTDFEVVISDNASTDETPEIVRRFCSSDERFRYVRQPSNIGARANYQATVELAQGPLFLWRAYDDLSSHNYLAELIDAADRFPDAELIVPRAVTIRVGKAKKRVRPVSHLQVGTSSGQLLSQSNAGWFYGLYRADYARRTIARVRADYPHLWAWDHALLFPAILSGRVAFADRAVFFHRLNAYAEKASRPTGRDEARRILRDYLDFCHRLIAQANLAVPARIRLQIALLRFVNRRVMPLRRLA